MYHLFLQAFYISNSNHKFHLFYQLAKQVWRVNRPVRIPQLVLTKRSNVRYFIIIFFFNFNNKIIFISQPLWRSSANWNAFEQRAIIQVVCRQCRCCRDPRRCSDGASVGASRQLTLIWNSRINNNVFKNSTPSNSYESHTQYVMVYQTTFNALVYADM